MTRRFLIGIVCLTAMLGVMLPLPGCTGGSDKPERSGMVIGVSIPSATHGWPAGVIWWAEQTMKEYPDITWEFNTAGNANEQAGQIEAMLVKGIDALVVLPFDSDTPMPAIRRAKQLGVYVVSVDRGLRQPIADVYIAGDNRSFGRKSAEYMAEKLNGEGAIVVLRGMQVEIDQERYEGAMEVFNQHAGITVLASEHGNWNRMNAHSVMQTFLTRFPKIDAVWASDDDMALGVEQALREAGRLDEMWILGGAGMKDIVKRVMDGDRLFPANITYPPGMIAAGIHLAVAHVKHDGDEKAVAAAIPAHLRVDESTLRGKDDPAADGQRNIKLDVHLITPENAKEFYFPDSVY
jgi:ribose transport system substrate-binding protein